MKSDRSRAKLLDFLDYLAAKGLMASATVSARKAAVSKVLGILSEDEAADVSNLNLDEVMARFTNLEGKSYTPGSLTTYRSRVRSALDDFNNYLANPLGFKPSVQVRERKRPDPKSRNGAVQEPDQSSAEREQPKPPLSNSILPIPIRPDITIFVQGIPYDLTESEAMKIANVIRAMATPA